MLSALLFGFLHHKSLDVNVTREPYKDWADCLRISNGSVELVVVPQIGRIMRFGEVGKLNLLYEFSDSKTGPPSVGGWKNWGGDKVWPAPQSTWGWPPEPEYDGSAWEAHPIPNGVQMASKRPSAKLGVRFERTIILNKGANTVLITNTLINESGKTVRFAPWEVCQVDDPKTCILPVWKSHVHPQGWRVYGSDKVDGLVRERGDQLYISRDPKRGVKYGSGSPKGVVTAIVGNYSISISSIYSDKAEYPDEGNAQQIYTNADPVKYAELELSGPLVTLGVGKSTSMTVTMSLKRLR